MSQTRRNFLKTSTAAAAGAILPYWFTSESSRAFGFASPNERPILGCIGTGDRWHGVGPNAMAFANCVAVCDVDANHMEEGREIARAKNAEHGHTGDIAM
ncbi:MAG: twin-arginine translocation signal domain-containing protein, partial [Planctomycetaceae bacterium]|nr:twin-arginine translocation signal domain-containing protein [Planctomycetaceae bacterium]